VQRSLARRLGELPVEKPVAAGSHQPGRGVEPQDFRKENSIKHLEVGRKEPRRRKKDCKKKKSINVTEKRTCSLLQNHVRGIRIRRGCVESRELRGDFDWQKAIVSGNP